MQWWKIRKHQEVIEMQNDPINDDQYNLNRFVEAQAGVYNTVLSELKQGYKRSHWMWFIFPQLAIFGRSGTSKFYGITCKEEAALYLSHPLLGMRLKECANTLISLSGRTAHDIFSSPDDKKLRSCMTLFNHVSVSDSVFEQVLDRYYQGKQCQGTIEYLNNKV